MTYRNVGMRCSELPNSEDCSVEIMVVSSETRAMLRVLANFTWSSSPADVIRKGNLTSYIVLLESYWFKWYNFITVSHYYAKMLILGLLPSVD